MTPSSSSWLSPPPTLGMGRGEVHVWRVALDLDPSAVLPLQQILSADEESRAGRFYFLRDREHFTAARGRLRALLGHYLNRNPAHLQFCYGPQGKPALSGPSEGDGLCFNLSHSHGIALIALGRARQVGVDIEWTGGHPHAEHIADRFFSPREAAAIRALPGLLRRKAFFQCWTCKEAYLKACGGGLGLGLDRVEVSLDPQEPPTLVSAPGGPDETSRWSLRQLSPGPAHVGALVVEGHDWHLNCWAWADRILTGNRS